MTTVNDLDPAMTRDEWALVFRRNSEPFATLAQCELLIRAAAVLRQIDPEEAEQGGERIRTRDIDVQSQIARRARAAFQYGTQKPVHIIPPANLR